MGGVAIIINLTLALLTTAVTIYGSGAKRRGEASLRGNNFSCGL